MIKAYDKLLDEVWVAEESDVACPAQEGVEVALFDAEEDV
jgi:hypothetical protein